MQKIKIIMKINKNYREIFRILKYRMIKKMYMYNMEVEKKSKLKIKFGLSKMKSFEKNEDYRLETVIFSNKIIDGIYYDISGKEYVFGKTIDWHKDYVYDYVWEVRKYYEYNFRQAELSDIKNVWENSRLYLLPVLANAWSETNQSMYLEKAIFFLDNWIKENPKNLGVNWTVSMEVSIRAINIIEFMIVKGLEKNLTDEKIKKYNSLIWEHGDYIFHNLEKGLITNNHYLSNLMGLIWIATYFLNIDTLDEKKKRIIKKWLIFSQNQLCIELDYQVYEDGFVYEDSTAYHCFSTEMVLLSLLVMKENKIPYPDILDRKLHKMVLALKSITVNQHIPIIGDIDNGRVIKLDLKNEKNKDNFNYLIDIYEKNYGVVENLKNNFENFGLYRLSNENFDSFIRCGKIGMYGKSGHGHNDQLSVILYVDKMPVFVDPGTGVYTKDKEKRRKFRSTENHNTVVFNNIEQNNINGIFSMIQHTKAKKVRFTREFFEGYLQTDINNKIFKVQRSVFFENETKMTIIDKVEQNNKPYKENAKAHLVLHPSFDITNICEKKISISNGNINLEIECSTDNIYLKNEEFSESYGRIENTKKIIICFKEQNILNIIRKNRG